MNEGYAGQVVDSALRHEGMLRAGRGGLSPGVLWGLLGVGEVEGEGLCRVVIALHLPPGGSPGGTSG